MRFNLTLAIALCLLGAAPPQSEAGQPGPPRAHSPERRQANMLMLRFQDALAEERWAEALALCSDRVQAKATEWPSVEEFFKETIPVERLLAQDFGCWSCGNRFFGLLIDLGPFFDLPESDVRLPVQWYWGIAKTNESWVVDYPPVRLDEYVIQRRAARQEARERRQKILDALAPKLEFVRTQLVPLTNRYAAGAPMFFRLELLNEGESVIHFMNAGVAHHPLSVRDAKKRLLPGERTQAHIFVHKGEVAPNGKVVIADYLDLTKHVQITKPGVYYVQFDSGTLSVGEALPFQRIGSFGENIVIGSFNFLAATNKFPSNVVKIRVAAGPR